MSMIRADRTPVVILLAAMILWGCEAPPSHAADDLPNPKTDLSAPSAPGQTRSVVLAAGCFWCVEAVFEELAGVSEVVSGYAGGTQEDAVYKKVSDGATNHAEVVKVSYDPSKITYGQLLKVFFTLHDPTTKDRQGPDWGRQYRSAVFYENDEQKRVAEAYMKQLKEAKAFKDPIVTTLEPLGAFYAAEEYHQDFVKRNPRHPYVVQWALPKLDTVHKKFPEQLKKGK